MTDYFDKILTVRDDKVLTVRDIIERVEQLESRRNKNNISISQTLRNEFMPNPIDVGDIVSIIQECPYTGEPLKQLPLKQLVLYKVLGAYCDQLWVVRVYQNNFGKIPKVINRNLATRVDNEEV